MVWLGGHDRLADKWTAVAAILAAESSAGAEYIDVRMPERAAAGGLAIEPPVEEEPIEPAVPEAAPVEPAVPDPAAADPQSAIPQSAIPEETAPVAPATDPQPVIEP